MVNLVGCEISSEAYSDLDDIFNYTELMHGFDQAIIYLMALDTIFKSLVINPEIGRRRDEIKFGLYSIIEKEHVIFYRILEKNIRIIRILHGRKDIPKQF